VKPVPDSWYVGPTTVPLNTEGIHQGMYENIRDQITKMLREFVLDSKGPVRAYQKPYPEYFDTVPYPRGFRVPDFIKFIGEDSKTTYEHIG
jgi:hypothetical protein